MLVAEGLHRLEVAGQGRDAAHVADDGLDDNGGDFAAVGGEGGLDGFDAVVGQGERGFSEGTGTPAVSAMPRVAMPLPALTSRESTWPW